MPKANLYQRLSKAIECTFQHNSSPATQQQAALGPSLSKAATTRLHDNNRKPVIWVVMGYRAGENSQILALAEAIGADFEVKRLTYRRHGIIENLIRRVGISAVNLEKSTPLTAPWPELVISAGLRNESACRWIKRQSGGKTRLAQIGRPWAALEHFDLVITTPQYRLAQRPNVLQNHTTLHRVTEGRLQQAALEYTDRLTHLPQPYTAVIVGGNSGPYTFGPRAAARLGREASDLALETGGSLLVTTSSRTPVRAADALANSITAPAEVFRWHTDSKENPYFAFLSLADRIIVTGDSIAMLSEACSTGKPVYIFDLGSGRNAMRNEDTTSVEEAEDVRLSARLYRLLMRFGPRRLSRDLRLVHQWLVEQGHAVWLGDRFPESEPPVLQDIERAVARAKTLLKTPGAAAEQQSSRQSKPDPRPPAAG